MRGDWVLLVLLVPAMLGSCGEPVDKGLDGAGEAVDQRSDRFDAEAVRFGEALAQIRGHHLVALELYRAGDEKGAAVHAGHPIAEILDSVRSEVEEHEPAVGEELATALEEGANAIAEGKPADEVAAAFEYATAATDRALTAVVGDATENSSYKGSVIAALVSTAGHEYEEAIGRDGVRLLPEYQDGYGFVQEARRLYEDIASDVEAASTKEAEEIEEAFQTLERALPSPLAPAELADKLEVESAAKLIGREVGL